MYSAVHINLMLMLLIVIIAVNNMFTLSLNVFICLNTCGLYNACMSYVQRGVIVFFQERLSLGNRKVVLQLGIRAKGSTLSLDGPVEWSLDRGCEEKLCLEDQFRTLLSSGGIVVCETASGVATGREDSTPTVLEPLDLFERGGEPS